MSFVECKLSKFENSLQQVIIIGGIDLRNQICTFFIDERAKSQEKSLTIDSSH